MLEEKIDEAIKVAKSLLPARTQKEDIQKTSQAILNLAYVKSTFNDYSSWENQTDEMDKELGQVLEIVRPGLNGTELVQVTQAALNLMNAKATLIERKSTKKKQGSNA